MQLAASEDFLASVRSHFKPRTVKAERPKSGFPELVVRVPDSWPHIDLAPLYDVHMGASAHNEELFDKHLKWLAREPHVLSFNGGDLIENATKLSVGAGVYAQDFDPQNQLVRSTVKLAKVRHKLLFSLPGNHEDRAELVGLRVGEWVSMMLEVPYFPDYCFCSILWRGNSFRILAHHGTGAAQTAGAQRMAARKDLAWAHPFDLVWTGHLHNPIVDVVYRIDRDQRTGETVERNTMVIISPSYLGYFGTYAAKKRYPPGTQGLAVVRLQPDGRIDAMIHARGKRL